MSTASPGPFGKILVREVNWLGDAVLTLPALAALARRFPQAEITVLAKPWVAGLLKGQRGVDRLLEYQAGGIYRGLRERWDLARQLARERFDLAILFPNSLDAALVPWLARIPRRVGFGTDGRGVLLTDRVPPPPKARPHQVFRYLALAQAVGAAGEPVPVLDVHPKTETAALRLLSAEGIGADEPCLALNPGSIYGDAKRWLPERFARVADIVAQRHGARVLLIGSAKEREILDAVARRMQRPSVQLGGRTDLATLAGVLRRVRLLLSNDTGAMHVAAAIGTPVLAVFGPTDAEATGPLGPRSRIARHPVPCSPCLLRACPIDHRCMSVIGEEEVVAAAEELWS